MQKVLVYLSMLTVSQVSRWLLAFFRSRLGLVVVSAILGGAIVFFLRLPSCSRVSRRLPPVVVSRPVVLTRHQTPEGATVYVRNPGLERLLSRWRQAVLTHSSFSSPGWKIDTLTRTMLEKLPVLVSLHSSAGGTVQGVIYTPGDTSSSVFPVSARVRSSAWSVEVLPPGDFRVRSRAFTVSPVLFLSSAVPFSSRGRTTGEGQISGGVMIENLTFSGWLGCGLQFSLVPGNTTPGGFSFSSQPFISAGVMYRVFRW